MANIDDAQDALKLKQLSYFLTLAEYGSISAAANALNMAQPSLSENIAKLERQLDVQLAIRGSRGEWQLAALEVTHRPDQENPERGPIYSWICFGLRRRLSIIRPSRVPTSAFDAPNRASPCRVARRMRHRDEALPHGTARG